jgi:zinc protease
MDPWPAGHPLYTATFEEQIEGLNAATLDEVRQFYTDFYGADRGHMAIVGDFDPDEVLPMVEETFGSWEASSPTERIPTVYRDISAERIVIETPDRANAAFYAGLNLPIGDDHPDYPALVLGNYMLGGGILKSRLATRIRGEEGLSYIVDSRLSGHPVDGNGQFTATATCAPENAERVEAAFREEIDRVLDAGYTADEVEAAKAGYLDSRGVSRSGDATLADTLSQGLYFNRTMQWQKEFEEKIATLTPEQILEAFRRYIDPDKITVVMAGDFAKGVVPDR